MVLIFAGVFVFAFSACKRSSRTPVSETVVFPVSPETHTAGVSSGSAWKTLALLKTGAYPLWFEFSNSGPRLISSPAESSLVDFTPWPHSRFCSGMLTSGNDLVLAINREGFLIVSPAEEGGSAILYQCAGADWEPYTIASVFMHEEKPAVLLYRDDFFSPLPAPAPDYPVKALSKDHSLPIDSKVPAFDMFLEEGWEVNALRRGSDNFWYYRFTQTGSPQPGTVYFRTSDLSAEGERTGLEDYRNSARPENASNAPSFLTPLLTAAAALPKVPVLKIISPETGDARSFSPNPASEEDFVFFFGYYRSGTNRLAFAVMPNGEGYVLKDGVVSSFFLPALPEGFIYTGAGLAGDVLVAVWEEQKDLSIGAAGFMALNAETYGFFRK